MTSDEYRNATAPKLQRCHKCLDWITVEQTKPMMEICPYCGSIQSSLTYDEEFDKKLLQDADLQKRDLLLRMLRIWQFRAKNKLLMSYEEIPPFFKSAGSLEKK